VQRAYKKKLGKKRKITINLCGSHTYRCGISESPGVVVPPPYAAMTATTCAKKKKSKKKKMSQQKMKQQLTCLLAPAPCPDPQEVSLLLPAGVQM